MLKKRTYAAPGLRVLSFEIEAILLPGSVKGGDATPPDVNPVREREDVFPSPGENFWQPAED